MTRGEKIGAVGRSGPTANNHPHLHFEIAYDKNNDGIATWGEAGSERVAATFNGKALSGASKTWLDVVSHSCSAPAPTQFCSYRITANGTMRSYAGTQYDSEGTLTAGTNLIAGVDGTLTVGGTTWRRLSRGTGSDGSGAWFPANSITRVAGGCTLP